MKAAFDYLVAEKLSNFADAAAPSLPPRGRRVSLPTCAACLRPRKCGTHLARIEREHTEYAAENDDEEDDEFDDDDELTRFFLAAAASASSAVCHCQGIVDRSRSLALREQAVFIDTEVLASFAERVTFFSRWRRGGRKLDLTTGLKTIGSSPCVLNMSQSPDPTPEMHHSSRSNQITTHEGDARAPGVPPRPTGVRNPPGPPAETHRREFAEPSAIIWKGDPPPRPAFRETCCWRVLFPCETRGAQRRETAVPMRNLPTLALERDETMCRTSGSDMRSLTPRDDPGLSGSRFSLRPRIPEHNLACLEGAVIENHPIIHFVGSIPLPDAETVLRTLAETTRSSSGSRMTSSAGGHGACLRCCPRSPTCSSSSSPPHSKRLGLPRHQNVHGQDELFMLTSGARSGRRRQALPLPAAT